ncbi:MAG: hypothetical protein ACYS7Y_24810 [Planctomycetota bacterium]|jgi:hypothetical protein
MTKTNLNNEQAPDNDTSEKRAGNFIMGECSADIKCRHGHNVRLFNIGRGHYVACDECKTYIFAGANLMSCWRQENKDIWQANYDSVKDYVSQLRCDVDWKTGFPIRNFHHAIPANKSSGGILVANALAI